MKKEKGITLIALVVTIVVLLILAGVSISMITGENGIITQAQDAKLVTERASLREKLQLVAVEEIDRDSLEIFKSLGYVGEDNVVKVEAIPYLQLTTGKGTNGKDMYGIILQDDKYQLLYIDKNGDVIEVGEVGQKVEEDPFLYTQADIDETLKYFKWRIEEVTEELKEQRGYSDDTVGKKVAIIYDTVKDYYIYYTGEVFPINKIVIPNTIEDSDFVDIKLSFNGIANVNTIIYLNDYGMFINEDIRPSSVKNIKLPKYGKWGFLEESLYCLENVKIDDDSQYIISKNGVLFSKDMKNLYFYPRGKKDTSYTIPNGVENISPLAFYGCKNLNNIFIPNSVTNIYSSKSFWTQKWHNYYTFGKCTNLVVTVESGSSLQLNAFTDAGLNESQVIFE